MIAMLAALALAACGGESGNAPGSTETAEAAPPSGKAAFTECAVCHVVREGERSLVGPNLFGVYGRTAGSDPEFAYTDAMKNSGITWDDESLNAFLENPQALVRGNRMAYPGAKDAEKRAAIIDYLKTLH